MLNLKAFISIGVAITAIVYVYKKPLPPLQEIPDKSYDYIVVGAGSAGSVVAGRLSENPNVTVLLVEAGSDDRDDWRVHTPACFGMLLENAWSQLIHVTGDASTAAATGSSGVIPLRAGMVMGGGSSVNGQIYARGSRHDFDRWAEMTKDDGWAYEHVLKYFKKSERAVDEDLRASPYHGSEGPLSVSTHQSGWDVYKNIIAGFQELGFPFNQDYNGKSMEGIAYSQYNRVNGERVSSAKAFIHPVIHRPNLHVTTDAFTQRVMIRKGRAYGIEMVKKSIKYKIKAKREVILSAGGINSPKILMNSGIGPKEILTKHGIPVVKDLPVGRNLQNHPIIDVSIGVTSPVTGVLDSFLPELSFLWYKLFKSGWLATTDADTLLFTSITQEAKEKDWPDLQLMFIGKPLGSPFMKAFDFKDPIIEELGKERDLARYGFACFPSLQRPQSAGHVSIVSNDPFELPFVKIDYLDDENDMNLLVKGMRLCQSLVHTTAMQKVGAYLTDTVPLRNCKEHEFNSDEYLKCYIRTKPMLHFHPAGTCRMGAEGDPSAVLDSKLRVWGVEGLRVVDASAMPRIVAANVHAAIVMMAEKAVDMIRCQYDGGK